MAEQVPLWFDNIEEAVKHAVLVLGGPKKIAKLLWPALAESNPATAYTRLMHCLDPAKKDKLDLSEFLLIARKARDVGEHSIAKYFGRDVGYDVTPVDAEELEKRARKEKMQWHLSEMARLALEDN